VRFVRKYAMTRLTIQIASKREEKKYGKMGDTKKKKSKLILLLRPFILTD